MTDTTCRTCRFLAAYDGPPPRKLGDVHRDVCALTGTVVWGVRNDVHPAGCARWEDRGDKPVKIWAGWPREPRGKGEGC